MAKLIVLGCKCRDTRVLSVVGFDFYAVCNGGFSRTTSKFYKKSTANMEGKILDLAGQS